MLAKGAVAATRLASIGGRRVTRSVRVHATSGTTDMATQRAQKFSQAGYRRPLHWVFKVGDLEKTLHFYQEVLGMHVHRHEEFASGCEATCNGPYGGAWSKTMVGYGGEETNFALELTYNYGIDNYEQGNDLRHIAIKRSALKANPADKGYTEEKDEQGRPFVKTPDGYKFLLVDTDEGPSYEPFLLVSLNTSDLEKARKFYTEVMGGTEFSKDIPGAEQSAKSAVFGWTDRQSEDAKCMDSVKLELVQLEGSNAVVDHKAASGRYAIETEDGGPEEMKRRLESAGNLGSVMHGPFRLQPHNEEVLICTDFDGHEYCFVDARNYTNCIHVRDQPGGRDVNWEFRRGMHEAAKKGYEGDTEASRLEMARLRAGEYDKQGVNKEIDQTVSSSPVVIFAQSDCKFCAKAKSLLDSLQANYEFVELDAMGDKGDAIRLELHGRTGRATVPNIFIGGENIGGYGDGNPGLEPLHSSGELEGHLKAAGALKQ